MQDSFTSTPGPLVGTVPSVGGTWTAINPSSDEIQVVSGSLTAPTGMIPSTGNRISWGNAGEDASCSFTSQNSGTVYYSFLINLTNNASSLSGGNIMGLAGPNGGVASLAIRRDANDSTKYNIGYYESATFNGPHWTSTQLSPNTTHLVVIAYQFVAGTANDVISLWLDPTSFGGAAPVPTISATKAGTDSTGLNSIQLWQRDSSTPSNTEIDELRVGTTWADVAPGGDLTVNLVMGTYNFSWTFSQPVIHGNFVDGQPWVIRPSSGLNLVAVTPARQNGASVQDRDGNTISADIDQTVVNPPIGTYNDASGTIHSINSFGWDSRGCIRYGLGKDYDSTLSWSGAAPLPLAIGDSVTTPYSRPSSIVDTCLDCVAVLTVLDSAPPAGAFRPGFTRTATRRTSPEWFTTADLIDLTPYLINAPTTNMYGTALGTSTIPGTFTAATLTAHLPGPSIMNIGYQDSRSANATYNNAAQGYGQFVAEEFGDLAIGALAAWLSPADRQTCQYRFLQRAIDTYETLQGPNGLVIVSDGGHLCAYAVMLTVAGKMFNNHPGLLAINTPAGLPNGLPPAYYFGDYTQFFYMVDPAAAPGPDAPPTYSNSNRIVSFQSTGILTNQANIAISTATASNFTLPSTYYWGPEREELAVQGMKVRITSGTGAGTTDYVVTDDYGYLNADGSPAAFGAQRVYGGTLNVKPNWVNGTPDTTSRLTFSAASKTTAELPSWGYGGGGHTTPAGDLDFSPIHSYADINAGAYMTSVIAMYKLQANTYYTGGADKWMIRTCGIDGYGEVVLNTGNSRYTASTSSGKPDGEFIGGLWRNIVMTPLSKPIVGSGNGLIDRPYPPAGTPLWNN